MRSGRLKRRAGAGGRVSGVEGVGVWVDSLGLYGDACTNIPGMSLGQCDVETLCKTPSPTRSS